MFEKSINPKKIGFDFDGVIADIGEAFLRLACEKYGYCSFKLEDITSFKVETCTRIPDDIVDTIFKSILADSLATGLLPIPGALNVLSRLSQHTEVIIITARDEDGPVLDWLANYLNAETCKNIRVIAMCDHDKKVGHIRQQKLNYFIDDRAETCVQVADAGLTPILYRQPWNSRWNNFATVRNWQEIEKLFDC